jgi:hypothetical protein
MHLNGSTQVPAVNMLLREALVSWVRAPTAEAALEATAAAAATLRAAAFDSSAAALMDFCLFQGVEFGILQRADI